MVNNRPKYRSMRKRAIINEKYIQSRDYTLLELNSKKAIFEDGYWMTRQNYEFINSPELVVKHGKKYFRRRKLGLDINNRTKDITYHFLPGDNNHDEIAYEGGYKVRCPLWEAIEELEKLQDETTGKDLLKRYADICFNWNKKEDDLNKQPPKIINYLHDIFYGE